MSNSPILVTGGAGYIGSHFVRVACEHDRRVIVLDDLSGGRPAPLPITAQLVVGDVGDRELVEQLCRDHGVESAVHFAGKIDPGASVREPECYFDGNTVRSLRLLDGLRAAHVKALLFSSTAAVYGRADSSPIAETARLAPVSPYGASKLAVEYALAAEGEAHGLAWGALRYFNAAGAHHDGTLGEHHQPETHLIPLAIDAALGRRAPLVVYGTDYPTEDGTCIRDYIHVEDLAEAHWVALEAVAAGRTLGALNLGTGHGHSVLQVLDAVARVLGREVPHSLGPRRPGDPPRLVADVRRAIAVLGWRAKHASLDEMIEDAVRARRTVTPSASARPNVGRARDGVDQSSWESFPASDPPGWISQHAATDVERDADGKPVPS